MVHDDPPNFDPMTANFDDVNMPTESVKDLDPESGDSDLGYRPDSQSRFDGLSALGVSKEEANRPMIVACTPSPTSLQSS